MIFETLTGKVYKIDIKDSKKISEIKNVLKELKIKEFMLKEFVYNQKKLEDDKYLKYYSINENCKIYFY